jgi:energy-converting hydrogenase Eha subunit A
MSTKTNINDDVINYLVDYYETFNSLPTPVIVCTKTNIAYTCFGANLKKKVEKAGGIMNLLTTFIGRGAKKELNARMEKRVKASRPTPVITIDGEAIETAEETLA